MAVGADFQPIHEALATQIRAYVNAGGRQTNVSPFPDGATNFPQITVHSNTSTYVDYFGTMGPNGVASMFVRIKIELDSSAGPTSVCIAMLDYLSVGTGNPVSVIDAIHSDRSLGGVVGLNGAAALTAEWDSDTDPGVAWIPVQILLNKQNAST